MLTQAAPDPKTAMATPSLTLPDETTIPAPPEQGEVVEKKKKTIAKKVALEVQSAEIKCLRKALLREEQASVGLKAALTLEEDKRKRAEEIDAEKEWVVEAFKSSKTMEDIKIAFTQEAILKGFDVCMERIVKKFLDMDLDFLTEEPDDEACPSNAGVASPIVEPSPKTFKPAAAAPELAPKPEVVENTPTSSATMPLELIVYLRVSP
ncbi:hypothetical protein COCNU_scaffold000335G000030 [Cocos nucifera]|nr:hypothetical protein [Cocos nucifera]